MGLRQLMVGMGAIILFSLSLMIFANLFILNNNPSSLVSNDTYLNSTITSFNARATELQNLGESSKELLAAAEPSPVFVFLIIKAAFTIPLGFLSFLLHSVGTVFTFLFTVFFGAGGSPFYIVSGVISGILVITIVIMIVRAIRIGETER